MSQSELGNGFLKLRNGRGCLVLRGEVAVEVTTMAGGEIRILLIVDDLAQAELIRDMLAAEQRQQYSVHHVHLLSQGLEALKEGEVDCVLVDLGLPDTQGLETALSVRRVAEEVPIIVLTVQDDEDVALKALPMDIQDYLIKGEINSAVLTRSIRYALQRKSVAERLSETEDRMRFAAEAAELSIWHWNVVKNEVIVDERSRKWFGLGAGYEHPYETVLERIHPEDRQRVAEAIDHAVRERGEYTIEFRVLMADETLTWVLSKGRAYYDQHGNAIRMDGINLDITRRKEREEALRSSELKFSRIFRSAPALIMVSTVKDGTIIDVNQGALQSLGYERDELVGHSVFEMQLWEDPQSRARVIDDLTNRRPVENLEMHYRRKGGQRIIGLLSAELVEVGGEQCALMLIRDITERKRAEEALLFAKEEWERTFNAVPDLIAILSTDFRILRVNAAMAQKVGRTAEECMGMPCYVAFHGTDIPPESCPHMKVVADSGKEIIEVQEGGPDTYFLVSYTPLFDADGKPAGVVHVARDITERKLAERRIEQLNAELASRAADLETANKELQAFNYTAAHDLRQPLNVIDGNCQAIEIICGSQISEDCRSFLGDIRAGIKRMTQLLDALLDFSRMSRVEPQRSAVDLSSIARSVAQELKGTEPGRAANFAIADGVEVNGDPALLEIVLRNLLGNAWKYTVVKEDAIIEFGESVIDGERVCFVRDNGPGFDMADSGKLFTPFQRLPGTHSVHGFGIGLATVQRIITRHGGKVWADGEPGKGATFYFTLG